MHPFFSICRFKREKRRRDFGDPFPRVTASQNPFGLLNKAPAGAAVRVGIATETWMEVAVQGAGTISIKGHPRGH